MSENNRPPRTRTGLPWSIQQIHENSHQIASSASQQLHELHDYVIQGLCPLINSPTLRSPPNSPSHSLWIENSEINISSHPRSVTSPVPESSSFIINIEEGPGNVYEITNANDLIDSNSESLGSGNRNNETDAGASALRNSPEMQALFAFAEKYVPFILILLLKLTFDHRIGILVNIGLFITFFHANTVVKREVAKQAKRRLRSLLMVFANLVASILVIYTILADRSLAYSNTLLSLNWSIPDISTRAGCAVHQNNIMFPHIPLPYRLIFVPPYSAPIDIWEVLWIVSVTDFVLRLITILFKLIFVALPQQLLAFQKKGKYYLFLERSSQFYRTMVPIQHWLYYFSESYSGPSKVFGVILSAAYLIFKFKSIVKKGKLWKETLIKVLQSKTYGVTPSNSQIKEAGDACPICQDDYKSPSMLQCKHIFCEECVALWFDRERTCPICRAQIADDPTWRDGSTTWLHQIF